MPEFEVNSSVFYIRASANFSPMTGRKVEVKDLVSPVQIARVLFQDYAGDFVSSSQAKETWDQASDMLQKARLNGQKVISLPIAIATGGQEKIDLRFSGIESQEEFVRAEQQLVLAMSLVDVGRYSFYRKEGFLVGVWLTPDLFGKEEEERIKREMISSIAETRKKLPFSPKEPLYLVEVKQDLTKMADYHHGGIGEAVGHNIEFLADNLHHAESRPGFLLSIMTSEIAHATDHEIRREAKLTRDCHWRREVVDSLARVYVYGAEDQRPLIENQLSLLGPLPLLMEGLDAETSGHGRAEQLILSSCFPLIKRYGREIIPSLFKFFATLDVGQDYRDIDDVIQHFAVEVQEKVLSIWQSAGMKGVAPHSGYSQKVSERVQGLGEREKDIAKALAFQAVEYAVRRKIEQELLSQGVIPSSDLRVRTWLERGSGEKPLTRAELLHINMQTLENLIPEIQRTIEETREFLGIKGLSDRNFISLHEMLSDPRELELQLEKKGLLPLQGKKH